MFSTTVSLSSIRYNCLMYMDQVISWLTICGQLADFELRFGHPLKPFPLTLLHRQCHLDRCWYQISWTVFDLGSILLSDESRFSLHADDTCIRAERKRDNWYNNLFLSGTGHSILCDNLGNDKLRQSILLFVLPDTLASQLSWRHFTSVDTACTILSYRYD